MESTGCCGRRCRISAKRRFEGGGSGCGRNESLVSCLSRGVQFTKLGALQGAVSARALVKYNEKTSGLSPFRPTTDLDARSGRSCLQTLRNKKRPPPGRRAHVEVTSISAIAHLASRCSKRKNRSCYPWMVLLRRPSFGEGTTGRAVAVPSFPGRIRRAICFHVKSVGALLRSLRREPIRPAIFR